MIKRQRLLKTFLELARIPGLSKKEGKIAGELANRLRALGLKVKFDRALSGEALTGNLIGYMEGNIPSPALLLNAHIDTVGPIERWGYKKCGKYILSNGKSILSADDRSGVAVILEVLAHLKESGQPRPRLEIVFTVAEEIGLIGAKNLDYSLLSAPCGIVLDSSNPLTPIVAAPEAYRLNFRIYGKEAHAGVAPERGLNAIKIASDAISRLKLGRIDYETTANIGIISGGTATNIVPKLVEVRGEARSHNPKKLKKQIEKMRQAFREAVKAWKKPGKDFAGLPKLEEEIIFDYPRMRLTERSLIVRLIKEAGKSLGKQIIPTVGGGGSDANIFNAHKIECLIIGTGAERPHSLEERQNLEHLYLSAQILAKAIELYPSLNKTR